MAMDEQMRTKIEAVESYLRASGLADVEAPPEHQIRAEFYTIRAAVPTVPANVHAHFRYLSLNNRWLQKQETPQGAVAELRRKDVAERLQGDEREIDILESGETSSRFVNYPSLEES
jgi:hypothetical protein